MARHGAAKRPHELAADHATGAVSAEQPPRRPRRHSAAADGAPAILRAVYPALFTQGRSIADRSVLAAILRDAGVPPSALAAAEAAEAKGALRQATEEAQSLGIYGAPSFITKRGELFWGNDRLEQAIAWAREL